MEAEYFQKNDFAVNVQSIVTVNESRVRYSNKSEQWILQFQKYLQPLKSPENAGLLDAFLVDEIFYQVPGILNVHQVFLEHLRRRLEQWDLHQKVGDIFLEVVIRSLILLGKYYKSK